MSTWLEQRKPIARRRWDFFIDLWGRRPHVSEVSGEKLLPFPGMDGTVYPMTAWAEQIARLVHRGVGELRCSDLNYALLTRKEAKEWEKHRDHDMLPALLEKDPRWAIVIDRYNAALVKSQANILLGEEKFGRNKAPTDPD